METQWGSSSKSHHMVFVVIKGHLARERGTGISERKLVAKLQTMLPSTYGFSSGQTRVIAVDLSKLLFSRRFIIVAH